MARVLTIADLVQQVYHAIYGVRLDVTTGVEGAFHSNSDKFKEVVMEANNVIQSLQKDQDWNWLRDRWEMGHAHHGIMEFTLPEDVYKPCTGYGDAVRLHTHHGLIQIPWTSPRMGNKWQRRMYDPVNGEYNTVNYENQAFLVGRDVCFKRPFRGPELHGMLETDVIREMPLLHICDDSCYEGTNPPPCKLAYETPILTEVPDPLYVIYQVASQRAELDPSATDRVQPLADRAKQILSAMRENDSAHTVPEYFDTEPLGFIEVI